MEKKNLKLPGSLEVLRRKPVVKLRTFLVEGPVIELPGKAGQLKKHRFV